MADGEERFSVWAHCSTARYCGALAQSEPTTIAPDMVRLMFRNVASDGYNTERGFVR